MKIWLVDETDTQWESATLQLRVFRIAEDGGVWAYDFDDATLADVEQWKLRQHPETSTFCVAVRAVNDEGRPGLLWLSPDTI